MTRETRVFADVPPLLDAPAPRRASPWGIVTNKATRFAAPLVAALGFGRAPRHARLRRHDAARQAASRRRCSRRRGGWTSPPAACVYVGDDRRDVDAGRAAGMRTVVAGLGLPRRRRAGRRPGAPTPSSPRPGELLALFPNGS